MKHKINLVIDTPEGTPSSYILQSLYNANINGIKIKDVKVEQNLPNKAILTIDEIIDEFDFQLVQNTMYQLNWNWVGTENGVPTIPELKKRSIELLKEVYLKFYENIENIEPISISTGGLCATYFYDEQDCFSLKFILTEYSNF